MSKLKSALDHARAGWPVFPTHNIDDGRCSCGQPCKSPGKHPRTRNGLKDATTNESQIRKWWKQWPDANVAGRTDGLAIADVDVRDGKQGLATLAGLEDQHGRLKRALVQRTGSGGLHIVFAARDGARYPAKLGKDIEIKAGDGGYVLLPGSDHESGGVYRWETGDGADGALFDDLPLSPAWFGAPGETKERERDSDLATHVAMKPKGFTDKQLRMIADHLEAENDYWPWLRIGMALHHEHEGSDEGLDAWDAFCADADLADYNADEIEQKWKSFKPRKKPLTMASLLMEAKESSDWSDAKFRRLAGAQVKRTESRGLTSFAPGEYDSFAPAFDFIPGMMQDMSVAMIYGPPGSGKTFFAIHLLCSAALGQKLFKRTPAIRRGYYIGLEGEAGIKTRIKAWCAHNGIDESPIHYALGSLDILDDDQRAVLIAYIKEHEIQFVVIDTLSRTMTGTDENVAKEMSPVIDALHEIKNATGACVTAITHTGKDVAAGIRGWSGQLGAADTTIEIQAITAPGEDPRPDTPRIARVRKQKDIEPAEPVNFVLAVHPTDVINARNEPVASLALDEHERFENLDAAPGKAKPLTTRERKARAILEALTKKLGRAGPPNLDQYRRALKRESWGPEGRESWERAFRRLTERFDLDSNGAIERAF